MSLEDAVYSRLTTFAGLSALVSTRVYPLHLPQKPTYPCIAYRRAATDSEPLLSTDTDILKAKFEIASFSKAYDSSVSVGDQIRQAFQRFKGVESSITILDTILIDLDQSFEADYEIYETALTFEIWYRA